MLIVLIRREYINIQFKCEYIEREMCIKMKHV
jgi:hypothetical protein